MHRHPAKSLHRRALARAIALLPLAALPRLGSAQQPAAAPARRLALLSLIGDELTIVGERDSTGSNINQNVRSQMALKSGAVDNAVMQLAQVAAQRAVPGLPTVLVAATDPALYKGHDTWIHTERTRLPADVVADLRGTGATEALVVLKHRADASFEAANGRHGTGQLEGLGYYLNKVVAIKDRDTLVDATGFLAPYAYLRVIRLDLGTGELLAQRRVMASRVVISPKVGGEPDPWSAVPDNRKLMVLLELLDEQLKTVVPELLGPR